MKNQYLVIWVLLLVDGVSGNEKKTVQGRVGESVILPTGFNEPPSDTVQWWFGGKIISKMNKAAETFQIFDGPGGIFKDRLELNNTTGYLTIKNISSVHAGTYKLQIKSTAETNKEFDLFVQVTGETNLSVRKGDSFSLSIDDKLPGDIYIQWKFGDQVIPITNLNGTVDERWSNIQPNNKTGELCFSYIQIHQSGNYEAKVNISYLIIHKKFLITVAQSGAPSGICGAGVGLVVWALTVFLLQEL